MTAGTWRRILIAAFLFASAVEFCVRGPIRLLRDGSDWNDFLSTYIQAKAWTQGSDPYSPQSLIRLWPSDSHRPLFVDAEAARGELEQEAGIPSPYPLTSLVVVAPFTVFSWSVALRLWVALNVLAVVLAPFELLAICGCGFSDLRSQLFLGCALALAPFHSGLGTANPAMLVVGLTVACLWAMQRGMEGTGGILLALAVCLKPSVAGGLLLFFLVRRRWKVSLITVAVTSTVAVIGMARLRLSGTSWFLSYVENTRKIFALGSVDDFTPANPIHFNMINAHVPLFGLLGNVFLANLATLLLVVLLLGGWLWQCQRKSSDLLAISFLCVVSLIGFYHRFYDAALLIWPLAWSLLLARKRSATFAVFLLLSPFFLPGASLLGRLAATRNVPANWLKGWLWNGVVMPHEAWALILLAILLLYYTRSTPEQSEVSLQLPG